MTVNVRNNDSFRNRNVLDVILQNTKNVGLGLYNKTVKNKGRYAGRCDARCMKESIDDGSTGM